MSNRRFVVSPKTIQHFWATQTLNITPSPRPIGLSSLTLFDVEVLVDSKMPDDVVAIVDEVGLRAIIHSGLNMTWEAVAEGFDEYEAHRWWDAREGKRFLDPEVLLVGTKKSVGPFYEDMWKIRTDMIKEVADKHRPGGFVGSI